MAAPTESLLRYLRRLAGGTDAEPADDAALLDRFVRRRDEDAFAALIARHGRLVLGVSRRVLRDVQKAEDVFQATFLVLAREAGTLRHPDRLPAWLHGTARRLALKCRRADARQRQREAIAGPAASAVPDPLEELSARELLGMLDEELHHLPEVYRSPLILCYLEGHTHEEAARVLGCTLGSVRGRVERGRLRLHARLVRRGLTLPAALLAAALAQSRAAAVPGVLIPVTAQAARQFATGVRDGIAAEVWALAEAGAGGMAAATLKTGLCLLLAVGLVTGAAALAYSTRHEQPPEAKQAAEPTPPQPAAAKQTRTDPYGDPLPAATLARMGTARLRHGSSVFFVAFLADGKQVLSAGEDGLARLWDVATGKEVRRFGTREPVPADGPAISQSPCLTVALSPDGKTLATYDGDGLVWLWDTATGRETGQAKGLKPALTTDVAALDLSPDGKTLSAAGPGGPIVLWNLAQGKQVTRFDIRADRRFGEDARSEEAIRDKMAENVRRPNGPAGAGQGIWSERDKPHLAFSADGKALLSANLGMNGRSLLTIVRLWDVAAGKELCRIETGDRRFAVSAGLSPDGKAVAWADQDATSGGTVHLVEAATGKELHRFPGGGRAHNFGAKEVRRYPGVGTRFAFAPDGRTLVTRAAGGQVVVWDVATGKELHRSGQPLPAPTWWGGITSLSPPGLAVSPDGRILAVAGEGNAVTLLNRDTGQELHARGSHLAAITAVRYKPDGTALTSLGSDGSVRTWEAATGKETGLTRVPDGMLTSALSADGRMVATAGLDGKVRLTEVATGKERDAIQAAFRGALRPAFSPDGKALAVGGFASATVRVYDVTTGKETRLLKPKGEPDVEPAGLMVYPFRIAPPPVFSSDGKLLAAPGRSVLHVWDVATGAERCRFALPPDRAVGPAVFAPDGRSVALDMQDGTVALWGLTTGKRVRVYESGPLTIPAIPLGGPPGAAAPLAPADPALLAFSPDGAVLVHSRGRQIAVWHVGSGKELGRLKGHQGAVLGGAFAWDGKTLATASADTTVLVWDVAALRDGAPKGPD